MNKNDKKYKLHVAEGQYFLALASHFQTFKHGFLNVDFLYIEYKFVWLGKEDTI